MGRNLALPLSSILIRKKEWGRVQGVFPFNKDRCLSMSNAKRIHLIPFLIACLFIPNLAFALETGDLLISSRPKGASIYLDEQLVGETDTTIQGIPTGSHKLKIQLAGHKAVEQIVYVEAGRITRIPVRLHRLLTPFSPRQPLLKSIDPWLITLVILLLAGIVVLSLIFKAILSRLRASQPTIFAKEQGKEVSVKKASVFGNYRITDKIANGGMAVIYKAVHVKNGTPAVLKVPYEQFQNDRRFLERFRREAELGQRLLHDNIVRIYEYGRSREGITYIAMEYLPGIDLRCYLDKYGKMPIKDAVKIIAQVCQALSYAHAQGIIHRDIKPENIMVPDKRGKGRVVLMDFGVAHAAYLGTIGTRSTYLGTPYYMSPDQITRRHVDGRSDIYSLGVVFYELLTGARPFDDADPLNVLIKHREASPPRPRVINPQIPLSLERIVMKMLAKRPADRYKGAEALLGALKRYMVREGIRLN